MLRAQYAQCAEHCLCSRRSCSNITLLAWVLFYWVLFTTLKRQRWDMDEWSIEDQAKPAADLNTITQWSGYYR